MAGVNREAEGTVEMQAGPGEPQRRDDRNLRTSQLLRECVFFENGGVAPAARAVELGHYGRRTFDTHAVDAVLVAVQREQPAIAAEPESLDRADDLVGLQVLIGECGVDGYGASHGVGGDSRLMPVWESSLCA